MLQATAFSLFFVYTAGVQFVAPPQLNAIEQYQQQLFEHIAPAVVYITSKDHFGSGFFINKKGLIITNNHVVKKATTVKVVLLDGQILSGKVIDRGKDVDVALVKVPLSNSPALNIKGFNDLKIGSWVASIGHGSGGIWSFTTGMVSNIYPSKSTRPIFQTQIPLNPGSSGGPVFNSKGEVMGIVTAGLKESNSINFSIRIDVALQALATLADVVCRNCITIKAPAQSTIFFNGQRVGSGPKVMVQAKKGSHKIMVLIKGKMHTKTINYPQQKEISIK